MAETTMRLLRLLTLLHSRNSLEGAELAARLGVAPRTVRRDVERLRAWGYPVEAEQGSAGYRLGRGTRLPPLILSDDEAVAVVLGLRGAAQQSVAGLAEASVDALTKLEQVLPSRLQHRAQSLASATDYAGTPEGADVAIDVLTDVAAACRQQERLRFDYSAADGKVSRREVEPHRMICFNRRWYLVAFDPAREDWRTFRLDRLTPVVPHGRRFEPREIPDGGAVPFLERQLSSSTWQQRAIFRIFAPAAEVERQVWPGMGAIEPEGAHTCLLHVGAPGIEDLRWMVTSLDVDFEVVEGPEALLASLRREGLRCLAAADPGGARR